MQTLFRTLMLESTYRLNTFQYRLRHFPVIKKLFTTTSYDARDFKLILMVLALFNSFVRMFFFSALYYVVIAVPSLIIGSDSFGQNAVMFFELLVLLTLIGGIINNALTAADYTDYYAICLLRINARDYLLSSQVLELAKKFGMAALFSLIYCIIGKQSPLFVLIFPSFLVAVKMLFTAIRLHRFSKRKRLDAMPIAAPVSVIATILLLSAAAACLITEFTLSQYLVMAIMLAFILAGIPCTLYVIRFDNYLMYFKRYYAASKATELNVKANVLNSNAKLVDEKTVHKTSSKSGFAFMNEVFLMRHHKLLMDATKIITFIMLAILALITALLFFDSEMPKSICGNTIKVVPYLPFAFYMINRGAQYSSALFSNCDRCMLNYSFYRKRSNILSLFRLRLIGISKQNLLPGFVFGAGLVFLEVLSAFLIRRNTGFMPDISPAVLLILFTAPIFVSIFFSVHYLTLYYLLQPFDHEAKSKSLPYNIAVGGTYVVCYLLYTTLSNVDFIDPLVLAIAILAFCIVYSALACLLVYLFAPKTFKNRR